MLRGKRFSIFVIPAGIFMAAALTAPPVIRDGGKTHIVDQRGERWDVTQAESIGFRAEGFEFGIGRDAFTPLDDSYLRGDTKDVPKNLRVIGVKDGLIAQAYSVQRLTEREIANSHIGEKLIAVGY